jgi:outer membrane protein assembly factor BamB
MSFKKHLVAMNAHTGERVWTFKLGLKANVGRLVVDHGLVLFATTGKLFCLDYLTGSLHWTTDLPSVVAGKPNMLVYAGCIVLLNVGEAVCFAAQDGRQLWHDKFSGFGIYEGAMAAPGVTAPIDAVQP